MSVMVTGSSEKEGVPLNTVIRHKKNTGPHNHFNGLVMDMAPRRRWVTVRKLKGSFESGAVTPYALDLSSLWMQSCRSRRSDAKRGHILIKVLLETGEGFSNVFRSAQVGHGIGNGVVVLETEQRR